MSPEENTSGPSTPIAECFEKLRKDAMQTAARISPEELAASYNTVQENSATLYMPHGEQVFYNPVQEFNRDLSIAVIRTWNQIRSKEIAAKKQAFLARQAAKDSPATDSTQNQTMAGEQEQVKFNILDALSASGLRAIRYAKEIPELDYVVANDLEKGAFESIKRNVLANDLSFEKVIPSHNDALDLMYSVRSNKQAQFHVIDLDPYGTASPFIDAAVQAVADGGLLCITCTDMATLAGGNQIDAAYMKYGGVSLPNAPYCHEMALRSVLHSVSVTAVKYKRYIVPLVALSIDFYVRIWVRVHTGGAFAKLAPTQSGTIYHCTGCHAYTVSPLAGIRGQDHVKKLQVPVSSNQSADVANDSTNKDTEASEPKESEPDTTVAQEAKTVEMREIILNDPVCIMPGSMPAQEAGKLKILPLTGPFVNRTCEHCGKNHHVAGPTWIAPIHNQEFVDTLLSHIKSSTNEQYKTKKRMEGMITVVQEEVKESPFYYTIAEIAKTLHCNTPKSDLICSALLNHGFKVSVSHAKEGSIKTNAPAQVIFDIFRKWVARNPVNANSLKGGAPGKAILEKQSIFTLSFKKHPKAMPESRKLKLVRYQETPKGWGPGKRAKGKKEGNLKRQLSVDDIEPSEEQDPKKARMETEVVNH